MREARVLRAVFLAGAVADAVALLPMLLPSFATLLWGLRDISDSYQLAMRCAASLMFGWTLLLVWASRRPLERRVVAPLTLLVVGGIVVSEIAGAGVVDAWRVVPTWCLQAILLVLFAWASYAGRQASRAPQVLP
jgi:peptidoglycan/LPS O-acetylase OafA/YrhL